MRNNSIYRISFYPPYIKQSKILFMILIIICFLYVSVFIYGLCYLAKIKFIHLLSK